MTISTIYSREPDIQPGHNVDLKRAGAVQSAVWAAMVATSRLRRSRPGRAVATTCA